MTHTEFSALRRCIALSPDIFLSETFSRKPLLSREADLGESFTDLFSRRDANRLLATGLRTSSVELVRGDRQLQHRPVQHVPQVTTQPTLHILIQSGSLSGTRRILTGYAEPAWISSSAKEIRSGAFEGTRLWRKNQCVYYSAQCSSCRHSFRPSGRICAAGRR